MHQCTAQTVPGGEACACRQPEHRWGQCRPDPRGSERVRQQRCPWKRLCTGSGIGQNAYDEGANTEQSPSGSHGERCSTPSMGQGNRNTAASGFRASWLGAGHDTPRDPREPEPIYVKRKHSPHERMRHERHARRSGQQQWWYGSVRTEWETPALGPGTQAGLRYEALASLSCCCSSHTTAPSSSSSSVLALELVPLWRIFSMVPAAYTSNTQGWT